MRQEEIQSGTEMTSEKDSSEGERDDESSYSSILSISSEDNQMELQIQKDTRLKHRKGGILELRKEFFLTPEERNQVIQKRKIENSNIKKIGRNKIVIKKETHPVVEKIKETPERKQESKE